jgi:hypothetical protein
VPIRPANGRRPSHSRRPFRTLPPRQRPAQGPSTDQRQAIAKRDPLTFIQDPYPSFSSITVDDVRNEIVVTDENRFRIMWYDRTATTPANAEATTPKRIINGLHTHTQYASDVYVDPPTGETFVINNDTVHNTTVYNRQASGDAPPTREFPSPYGNFGVAVDESKNELYLTLQHNAAIMVYKKSSGATDFATRLIQGPHTGMGDPHGIAFDPKNRFALHRQLRHRPRREDGRNRTGRQGADSELAGRQLRSGNPQRHRPLRGSIDHGDSRRCER